MTKNAKTIFLILIILVLGGLLYYSKKVDKSSDPSSNSFSPLGCYVARIDKDIYTLVIEEEKEGKVSGKLAYNNFEKDSSSGTLVGNYEDEVLLGNYLFTSEGMESDREVIFKRSGENFIQGFGPVNSFGGKETFKDISEVTYNPSHTFTKSPDCLEHFTDRAQTVSFDYNSFFAAREGDKTATVDWILNGQQKGLLLASLFVPKAYLPNTNFSDAHLTVGRSSDPNAINECTSHLTGNEEDGESLDVGGYPFTKFTLHDAGAGNLWETTSYRGIVDGDCYVAEYTIHSTNIANYADDQKIKEFDKSKIENELENTIKSIKFLVNSD